MTGSFLICCSANAADPKNNDEITWSVSEISISLAIKWSLGMGEAKTSVTGPIHHQTFWNHPMLLGHGIVVKRPFKPGHIDIIHVTGFLYDPENWAGVLMLVG